MPLRITGLVGVAVLLAAGEAATGSSPIDPWVRLTEFGLLAAFCWYGLSKALPRMQASYQAEAERGRAEAERSRVHYSEIVDELVARLEADRRAERETIQALIRHCAQREGEASYDES